MKNIAILFFLAFTLVGTTLNGQEADRKGFYIGVSLRPSLLRSFFTSNQVKIGYLFNRKFLLGAETLYSFNHRTANGNELKYKNDNLLSTGIFTRFYIPDKSEKVDFFLEPGAGILNRWGTDFMRNNETEPFVEQDFTYKYGYGKFGAGISYKISNNIFLNIAMSVQNNFRSGEVLFLRRTAIGFDFIL